MRAGPSLLRVLISGLLLVSSACGEPTPSGPPPEEEAAPLVLERKHRVAAISIGDGASLSGISAKVSREEIPELFPAALIRSHLWDWELVRENISEGIEFSARISAARDELGEFGSFDEIVVLDLLSPASTKLYCPPDRFVDECSFANAALRGEVEGQIQAVLEQKTPVLLVIGEGMHRMAASDSAGYRAFVSWFGGPLQRLVGDVPVTTSIDWEALRADIFAREESEAESPQDAALAVWEAKLATLNEHMSLTSIRSQPIFLAASDVPEDYYTALLDLLAENRPVVFTSLSWPNPSDQVSNHATTFLESFRELAAGFNVKRLAWARLIDLDPTSCDIWERFGVSRGECFTGLLTDRGTKKSTWDEILVTAEPAAE